MTEVDLTKLALRPKREPFDEAPNTPPTTPAKGDLWVKQSSNQLYFYDGTTLYNANGWELIGPETADDPFGITR